MRCSNCGWNNPDGIDTCQKCNQPLVFSPIQPSNNAFNPRATMMEFHPSDIDPRATMIDTQQSNINPRATMVDIHQQDCNPCATIVDVQHAGYNPRATMLDPVSSEKRITLFCIDDTNKGEIQIISTDLVFVPGEIVFIKNMRYQVK